MDAASPRKSLLRILLPHGAFLWVALGVCILAQAQDSGVVESPKNSFKPEQVWKVSISPDARQAADATQIQWNIPGSKVVTRTFGGSVDSTAYLEGVFKRINAKDWRMLWQDREFAIKPSGNFTLEIPYDSDLKSLELMAVSSTGEVEYHFYQLGVMTTAPPNASPKADGSSAQNQSQSQKPAESPVFKKKIDKRFFLSPGLGLTLINLTQTSHDPYSATVLTAKVSANYLLLPPNWDLGASGFATALTLSHNGAVSVRFFGLNLRLGYIFPQVRDPWRLALYGGWYYSDMRASDDSFGYAVSGPQLFPTLRRTLSNGQAITGYLKFSPVSNALSLMSLSSNEIAGGLGYVIPTEMHNYAINVDYARLSFSLDGTALTSSSITLGGSMSF